MNQNSAICWFSVWIPDSFIWFLPNKKISKKPQDKQEKTSRRFLNSSWRISSFVKTNIQNLLHWIADFSNKKNQLKESGIGIVNQQVMGGWFIWRIFLLFDVFFDFLLVHGLIASRGDFILWWWNLKSLYWMV